MKIIWALFDDGNQSVKTTMETLGYKVYSFGIQKKDTVEYLDMTQPFEKIKETLDKYPKPDFIVASPMCSSFSVAAAMKAKNFPHLKGNASWYRSEDGLLKRPENHYEGTRYNFARQSANAKLGEAAIINTLNIIQYYKPKCYYVENPKTSMIWDYIKQNTNYVEVERERERERGSLQPSRLLYVWLPLKESNLLYV